ncbi:MAG TPA: Sir2 family NAD-dependent protein deacetylase [Candidatus Bathyarchaeia archaeon]|nr:Sir2 family NAD-dependent protein deacetylase [Candidatus Bathyarchaeia archaeon]
MKKIYFFTLLLILPYTYPNILLQKGNPVSSKDIDKLIKTWETFFTWHTGFDQTFLNHIFSFSCCYEREQSSFIIQILGIPLRSYNFGYISALKKIFAISHRKRGYYFSEPLSFSDPSPHIISLYDIFSLLKNKTFIFYTGAGISAAGGVATMHSLKKSLKLHNIFTFLKYVLFYPKKITNAFSNFCTSAMYGLPTPAHYALHTIACHNNTCILTENIDLLQHRAGSAPIHTHSETLNTLTENDLQEIDVIVCVGLSYDDCGFLAHYKKKNPHGIIIAIDVKIPFYMSDTDYILQADLQYVLPQLADFLCSSTNHFEQFSN